MNKNSFILSIDLTSTPKATQGRHKHSTSKSSQLFNNQPQFQPGSQQTKSDKKSLIANQVKVEQNGGTNSSLTQQYRPEKVQALTLKTEPSYSRLNEVIQSPTPIKLSKGVKTYVKSVVSSSYHQIDGGSRTPNKSQSFSPIQKYVLTQNSPQQYRQTSNVNRIKKKENQQIKIVIRLKPLEYKENSSVKVNKNSLLVIGNDDIQRQFEFKKVLSNATQSQTYNEVASLTIAKAVQGTSNGVLLTYGQTGSGKTYTMGLLSSIETPDQGIVSLALQDLFGQLEKKKQSQKISYYLVELSFLQIYLDEVSDLLNPDSGNLQIREDKETQQPYVQGVLQVDIQNVEEGYQLIDAGIKHRVVASQYLNKNSSRSHTILILNLLQIVDGSQIRTKISFVDLAGSERVKKTNSQGVRMEEAKSINSSLSTLGNVIQALGNISSQHIPFRDSKLTRVLQVKIINIQYYQQPYLNGECQVTLICTVSQAQTNMSETLSTLLFACRCKEIILRPMTKIKSVQNIIEQQQQSDEYFEKIQSMQQQITMLQQGQSSNNEYINKQIKDQNDYLNLTKYLIKVIVKLKQYTTTLINEIISKNEQSIKIENVLDISQREGYELSKSEIDSLQQVVNETERQINNKMIQSQQPVDLKIDIDQLIQNTQKEEVLQKIQNISKTLISDITTLQQQNSSVMELVEEKFLQQIIKMKTKEQLDKWSSSTAYLFSLIVQKEKTLQTNVEQMEKELRAKRFQNALKKKIMNQADHQNEKIQIGKVLDQKLASYNEQSLQTTLNQLRQYSNNSEIREQAVKPNELFKQIYKKETMKDEDQSFSKKTRLLPPVQQSPQADVNISLLMDAKRQQSNPFNDISSLDNDHPSDRYDNSKLNLIDLNISQQNNNIAKQLQMIQEQDESVKQESVQQEQTPKYNKSNNLLPPKQKSIFSEVDNTRKKVGVSFVKEKKEIPPSNTNEDQTRIGQKNNIDRNSDKHGKSTIQALAVKMSSRGNSREDIAPNSNYISREDNQESVKQLQLQQRPKIPIKSGKSTPSIPKESRKSSTMTPQAKVSYNSTEKDLMNFLDDEIGWQGK